MRVLLGQIERLTETLNEFENNRNLAASKQVLDENIADVRFIKPDGSIVTLKKHRRQILKNAEDKATERVFNALKENGIHTYYKLNSNENGNRKKNDQRV
jgi:hypothetical protein